MKKNRQQLPRSLRRRSACLPAAFFVCSGPGRRLFSLVLLLLALLVSSCTPGSDPHPMGISLNPGEEGVMEVRILWPALFLDLDLPGEPQPFRKLFSYHITLRDQGDFAGLHRLQLEYEFSYDPYLDMYTLEDTSIQPVSGPLSYDPGVRMRQFSDRNSALAQIGGYRILNLEKGFFDSGEGDWELEAEGRVSRLSPDSPFAPWLRLFPLSILRSRGEIRGSREGDDNG